MSLHDDIHAFLSSHLPSVKLLESFENLSKDSNDSPLVSCRLQGYNFDDIARGLLGSSSHHKSSDVLYVKDEIYFIEFKRNIYETNRNGKDKRKSIREKMSSSLHILEKIILPNSITSNFDSYKINFIIVVDHLKSPVSAYLAITDCLASRSTISNTEFAHFEAKFSNHKFMNKRVFYDSVEVWNDTNFEVNISLCS